MTNTTTSPKVLKLNGKALAPVTTWDRYMMACLNGQVWSNPVWPHDVEDAAAALANEYGFQLFTWTKKEGLHGPESVRNYARKPQEFWAEFAQQLGFKLK